MIFGDLGNDWLVGGTGNDTLWGGWGNDLLQRRRQAARRRHRTRAPVSTTHPTAQLQLRGPRLRRRRPRHPDRQHRRRPADRLGRRVQHATSCRSRRSASPPSAARTSRSCPSSSTRCPRSQGADPTRATDTGDDPARNGEPDGELGLVTQKDHGLWQQQTGGPTDPQAGNIPGGKRDVLRSARLQRRHACRRSRSTAALDGRRAAQLQVAAASLGKDAAAVFYLDDYLPIYYEISADDRMAQKPTGGWKANAYVIFDYWSPTDFKFAGIDISINKMVIGPPRRQPAGSSTRRRRSPAR